ncbi:hypothetical protein [uncultured Anaerococcus sp.]|uniref:hypothetical protein n=1 Tax=uncultured Anaerococcus sp. TaxID=293428 RepID=UPI002805B1CE|nr:hypothetical protein [uncultured Anaerococcus sp.]
MQDFYMNLVKEKLKKYVYAKDFIDHATSQVEELKSKKESKMVASYGLAPSFGGGSSQEDKIINLNAKIEMLEKNIEKNKDIVDSVDYGLKGLSEEEIDITLSIYGKKQSWDKVKKLKDKYHYEKSQLYNIARAGIEHISRRLFGDS